MSSFASYAPSASTGSSTGQDSGMWDIDNISTSKASLDDCFKNIEGKGTFALYKQLESIPNPGLSVQGRSIGLPLSDDDAKFMVAVSHQAPFGKGEQMIVDETVRKT